MNPKVKVLYDPDVTLSELQQAYTLLAMDYFDGDKTQTACALGITVKTLYNRLDEYGIKCAYVQWQKGQANIEPNLCIVHLQRDSPEGIE